MCFVSGVSLREFAKDQTGKWLGRVSVLVGFCLLAAFGQFSIKQCQVIYAVAPPKVSPVAVVAVQKNVAYTSPRGIEIHWTEFNDGGTRSVPTLYRRGGINGDFSRVECYICYGF
jgi:hypothetical protein